MYDVIVVGAGPAGNMAALKLSGMGHKVAVVDWRQNIGDKLCTGIVGAECVRRFPPDEAHIYHRGRSAAVVSPAGKKYRIAREAPQAYIIDRVAYVGSLAQRAMEAGVEYVLGPRVTNIEFSDDEVTVLTRSGAGQGRYRAEMVIIASGFGSPLLNMVGLRKGGPSDHMVGIQAEVAVDELEETEVYLGQEVAPGSFGWLAPLSGSRALMGMVSRRQLKGHMGTFFSTLKMQGKVKKIIQEPRRWGIPVKPLPKTYGDRVLAVGDAAGLVKPTTGGGIYYALLSGEIAADSAGEALATGDFSAHRLKSYQKRWKALFGRELTTGYYARMLYEALGDRQIERLLSLCYQVQEELITSREFSFDWHSKVILKAIGHKELGSVIRSFGPVVTPFISRLVGARFS